MQLARRTTLARQMHCQSMSPSQGQFNAVGLPVKSSVLAWAAGQAQKACHQACQVHGLPGIMHGLQLAGRCLLSSAVPMHMLRLHKTCTQDSAHRAGKSIAALGRDSCLAGL
jgi:hypothetical protein